MDFTSFGRKGWDANARREGSRSLRICMCAMSVSASKLDSRVELHLANVVELLLLVRTHLWIKERRMLTENVPRQLYLYYEL